MAALEVEAIKTLKGRADKSDERADKAEKENKAMKHDLDDLKDRLDTWENTGHMPRANPGGFRFPTGNASYGLAGILGGFILADKLRRRKDEKAV
jgi:hypothetical protein